MCMAACSSPRKACRQGERLWAKAVYKCPQLLVARIDTVYLAGDTLRDTLRYAPVATDSLLSACDSLRAAVEVLALNSLKQTERLGAQLKKVRALNQVRGNACQLEPMNVFTKDYDLSIWTDVLGTIRYDLVLHPRKVPCPPCVTTKSEPVTEVKEGVATWYRTAFWLLLLAVVLYIAYRLRGLWLLCLPLLLTVPDSAIAQDFTRTLSQKAEGERSLVLNGIFSGADSVYVQVYHDGEELTSSVELGTFSLTLGTYDYYVVKFTDAQRRVKRLYIVELSDDMVEFFPPLEVDFDRVGNILLLKQSTGKPDWQEFDVGMSRKRP